MEGSFSRQNVRHTTEYNVNVWNKSKVTFWKIRGVQLEYKINLAIETSLICLPEIIRNFALEEGKLEIIAFVLIIVKFSYCYKVAVH